MTVAVILLFTSFLRVSTSNLPPTNMTLPRIACVTSMRGHTHMQRQQAPRPRTVTRDRRNQQGQTLHRRNSSREPRTSELEVSMIISDTSMPSVCKIPSQRSMTLESNFLGTWNHGKTSVMEQRVRKRIENRRSAVKTTTQFRRRHSTFFINIFRNIFKMYFLLVYFFPSFSNYFDN